nr:MAG TPA: hypothetical protein [Caudoviricetes sp.]
MGYDTRFYSRNNIRHNTHNSLCRYCNNKN